MLAAALAVTTSFSMAVGLGVAFGALVGATGCFAGFATGVWTGGAATGAGVAGAGDAAAGAGGAVGAGAVATAGTGTATAGGMAATGVRQSHTPNAMPVMVSVATKAIHKRLCPFEPLEGWT